MTLYSPYSFWIIDIVFATTLHPGANSDSADLCVAPAKSIAKFWSSGIRRQSYVGGSQVRLGAAAGLTWESVDGAVPVLASSGLGNGLVLFWRS